MTVTRPLWAIGPLFELADRYQQAIGLLTNEMRIEAWLVNIYMYMYMTDTYFAGLEYIFELMIKLHPVISFFLV